MITNTYYFNLRMDVDDGGEILNSFSGEYKENIFINSLCHFMLKEEKVAHCIQQAVKRYVAKTTKPADIAGSIDPNAQMDEWE